MILGLDVSTSCTGYSIIDDHGNFVDAGYIELKNIKNFWKKADEVKFRLESISKEFEIKSVFVEENLQMFRPGMSSAKTLSTLSRFNGIVCFITREITGKEPISINVNHARKTLGIKIIRKKDGGKGTKEQILDWVSLYLQQENYYWPTKILKSGPRKGNKVFEQGCYDIADAWVISKAGFILYSATKNAV